MKLYYTPGACSMADHIALEWAGKPYQAIRVTAAERASPEFRKLNPAGAVPVLVDEEGALTQNAAILTYIADIAPEATLIGDGTLRGRAEVMRWLALCNSDIHPHFHDLFHGSAYLQDKAAIERNQAHMRSVLNVLFERADAQLQNKNWLTGSRSVADPYLYVLSRWAKSASIDIAKLQNLSRFARYMEADTAVLKVLEDEGLGPVFADT